MRIIAFVWLGVVGVAIILWIVSLLAPSPHATPAPNPAQVKAAAAAIPVAPTRAAEPTPVVVPAPAPVAASKSVDVRMNMRLTPAQGRELANESRALFAQNDECIKDYADNIPLDMPDNARVEGAVDKCISLVKQANAVTNQAFEPGHSMMLGVDPIAQERHIVKMILNSCDKLEGEDEPRCQSLRNEMPGAASSSSATPVAAPQDGAAGLPPSFQGLADRDKYEHWVHSLTGRYRDGALYWEAHRSALNHPSCDGPQSPPADRSWTAGCADAQKMLAPLDALRRSSVAYRRGWNNWERPNPPP